MDVNQKLTQEGKLTILMLKLTNLESKLGYTNFLGKPVCANSIEQFRTKQNNSGMLFTHR